MKTYSQTIFLSLFLFCSGSLFAQEQFSQRTVISGLNSAWEITYGPDDSLWVTENQAYVVDKIDPSTGGKRVLINLNSKKNFTVSKNGGTAPGKWPQGGLMGLALHPSMYSEWPNPSKPYVYLAYVYQFNSSSGCKFYPKTGSYSPSGPCYFNTKIVRYTYDLLTHSLSDEKVIDQTLHGSSDHNGGRLAIGKVNGTDYLFYSIGEMGAGQFNNSSRPNSAQDLDSTMGKILRYNLEPEGDANQVDSWIPNDNPFTYPSTPGKVSPIWSYGHRNPQGIVFGSDGTLYSSEQQDMTDDEINIIERGGNYGWPLVSGYCDGNYTGLKLAGNDVGDEIANCTTLDAKTPIYTLFTLDKTGITKLSGDNLTWPTVATSGIDIYESNYIPGWKKSLLVPTLKGGVVYRLKLSADGKSVTDMDIVPDIAYQGRFRDLAISPDGKKIYVATDNSGAAKSSAQPGDYGALKNPGSILEFTYTGSIVMAIGNDSAYSYARNTQFQVYPNPATTKIHVNSIKSATKPLAYYLFNDAGRLARYGKSFTDAFDVDVSSLPRGLYILKVYDGYNRNVYTGKVSVQ